MGAEREGGWEPCGCWRWPSPAAGGRRAARVRPCGAASAAPWPETLRARASATSSSTVGAGAGSGMQARGPIPRGAPPHLACRGLEPAAATRGTAPSPTWTSRVAGSPPPTAAAGIVGCINASPAVPAPRSPVSTLPHWWLYSALETPFPPPSPHERKYGGLPMLHLSRSFPQGSIVCSLLSQPDYMH